MVDIEQKNKEVLDTPPSSGAPVAALPEASPDHMSKGEKWYNWMVYQGVNYWLNLGMSVVMADYFRNLSGRKYLDNAANFIAKGLSSTTLLKHETALRHSNLALKTLALCSGGWSLLIPMKWLEDRKRPVVHWLNKEVFKENQIAADGHEKTPDEIYIEKEQPSQTWLHVFWRRTQAQIAVWVAAFALNKGFAKKLDEPRMIDGDLSTTLGGEHRFLDNAMNQINRAFKSGYVPGGNWLAKNERAQRYVGFAALDWFYTMITASVMYVTRGAKHLKKNNPKEAKLFRETGEDIPLPLALKAIQAAPDVAKNSDEPVITSASSEGKLDGYKKKSITPVGKYTDMAKAGETDYSMAP